MSGEGEKSGEKKVDVFFGNSYMILVTETFVGFVSVTAALLWSKLSCDVTMLNWVNSYRRFERYVNFYLRLKCQTIQVMSATPLPCR